MKKTRISDFWFYKYRYQLTYGGLFLAFLSIIIYTIFVSPNALTSKEIESATLSANLSFSNIFSSEILNFPFRILQNLSISIFGLSNFSIKLPAILISIATVFAIIKLSHAWFSKGTATLAAILAIASSQFFFIAQNGTPEILYIFYPILLILAGNDFLKNKNIHSLVVLAVVLALSFYTPFSIYIAIALGMTILLHPHLRFVITREEKRHKIIGWSVFGALMLPLIISTIRDPKIIQQIFGFPEAFNIFENFRQLISTLFGFSSSNSTGVISPIINPAVLILVGVGIFFILSSKHTAKSYLVNLWAIILLFACLINPETTTILFTPILILTITGLQSLFQTWYTIFPKNPYARVLGLFPIGIFVASLFLTSLNNFRQNYIYSPVIAKNFNQDLRILLEKTSGERNLLVSKSEADFYGILVKKSGGKILSKIEGDSLIVSKQAFENLEIPQNYKIEKILVSSRKDNSDRFYILKKK